MAPFSPPVAAWELGIRLRRAREAAELSSTDAAKAIGVAQNYMSNAEYGRRRVGDEKLTTLLKLYDVSSTEADQLFELRRASEGTGWWSRYSGTFPPELIRYFGYEHGAQEVRTYEGALVSGLLQTEGYARALFAGDSGNMRHSEIQRRTEARLHRQQRLNSPDPLKAKILLAESALYQQVGGPRVLAEQLDSLLTTMRTRAATVDLRVVPFSTGAYGALGSSTFHLLGFPTSSLARLGWHETVTSLLLIQDEQKLHQYDAAFSEAMDRAADQASSERLIRDALARIT